LIKAAGVDPVDRIALPRFPDRDSGEDPDSGEIPGILAGQFAEPATIEIERK
jgi:hypothetical protein